jgi:hypothetical protein
VTRLDRIRARLRRAAAIAVTVALGAVGWGSLVLALWRWFA